MSMLNLSLLKRLPMAEILKDPMCPIVPTLHEVVAMKDIVKRGDHVHHT